MKNQIVKFITAVILSITLVGFVQADDNSARAATSSTVRKLQAEWAKSNYQLKGKEQVASFKQLLTDVDIAVENEPNNAAVLIWSGIIKSTYAGVKSGVGALKFAKASKADLERALKIDPTALNGSAYTSLGTLYFKVPGWPIGFGDKKKAKILLEKALEINPSGIDPNYFYGDYLRTKKKYKAANDSFQKALQAPDRAGRELADASRRNEIKIAITEIKDKL